MSLGPIEEPSKVAVEQLEYFGLSTYAAKTFVALASLGSATAREISEISDVPRTRIYDATDELHGHGLIDVNQTSPKEFWSISAETAGRFFEQEFHHRIKLLQTALDELESTERQTEQRGVWTVNGEAAVSARVFEFFDQAETEIVYMTVEELLTDEIIKELSNAANRGVSIKLGGISDEVQYQILEEIPSAEIVESLWIWSDTTAGRLMMVDNQQTLVSVLVNGSDSTITGQPIETAIWGAGESNSLVVVLRAIFTWRVDSDARLPT